MLDRATWIAIGLYASLMLALLLIVEYGNERMIYKLEGFTWAVGLGMVGYIIRGKMRKK